MPHPAHIMSAAERYRWLAVCYAKMAEHDDAPTATRMRFLTKANSCRVIARLAAVDEQRMAREAHTNLPADLAA